MAWAQIEEETSRTLKRYLAGRRVVDLQGPAEHRARGGRHPGICARSPRTGGPRASSLGQREVKAVVEVRVPFELDRQQIDDVERGAADSDWQPAKDAARKIAFAEDGAIFEGYAAADITGIRQGTSNKVMTLPADVRQLPDAIAGALSQLRLAGVNGPYSVVLGAAAYTTLAESSDNGYPILQHIRRLVETDLIWAPAIEGAVVLTTRGGDFDLHIGQDFSIGYLSHTRSARASLYLQESFTFLLLTTEAARCRWCRRRSRLTPAAAATYNNWPPSTEKRLPGDPAGQGGREGRDDLRHLLRAPEPAERDAAGGSRRKAAGPRVLARSQVPPGNSIEPGATQLTRMPRFASTAAASALGCRR